ncbi:5-oxoprolinase subunit B family protein [Pelagibacterium limicola]|uniref:5-oxoprolinase subunit B family protein n=1 Tax=Pelagibacterium limicola TaxID=2791022 RepID=UPI0018AF85CF|nr:carboxyltransferase domain-containing protein [Pelagibacterium limicola]
MTVGTRDLPMPRLMPLGDCALLVRFSERIEEAATLAIVAFADAAARAGLPGVVDIVPNLASVLLRYDPEKTGFAELSAEVRLLVSRPMRSPCESAHHSVAIRFGGEAGPDLDDAAQALGMNREAFIAQHNRRPLRVLATGFAPGFVYCGLHGDDMKLPRRSAVRDRVPAGSVLFAAGQTAITSTPLPTGWHVIGHTEFANFDASKCPPTRMRAGDTVSFEVLP